MGTTRAPASRMSAHDYPTWERAQWGRHPYLRGEVFAMAGGSPRHDLLGAAVLAALGAAGRSSTRSRSSTWSWSST